MKRSWTGLRRLFASNRGGPTIVRRRTRTRPLLEELENRVAPAVSLLDHFDSVWSGGGPPDTCGAAGPNSYIETGNYYVNIYNKSTNASIAGATHSQFFWTTGGITKVDANAGFYDATCCYDEPIGRFIVADMEGDRSGGGVKVPTQVDIAVSKNSNPTDLSANNWTFYSIGTTEGSAWSDYPGNIGYNADALCFTWNMEGAGNVLIDALSQSDLAAGGTVNYDYYFVSGDSWRPVTMHNSVSGDPMWFVTEHGDNSSIDLERVDNIMNYQIATFHTFNIGVNSYNSVNTPLNPDGSVIVPGPNGVPDTRILKAAENNNDIVACQSVGVNSNEDDARWYEFNVSNINSPYLVQQGNVGYGANTYIVYPGIDINSAGDIGMGFTKVGNDTTTDYMSTYITGWNPAIDSTGNMETPLQVKAGDSNNTVGRMGDFSGINLDPYDGTFWVNDEYTSGSTSHQEIANFAMNTQNFYLVGSQLQILGDQLGSNYNDTITLNVNGRGGVYATLNGEQASFDPGQVTNVYIDPRGGSNPVYIYNVPANCGVDVTGDGYNIVNLGNPFNGVQGINSTVFVYNGFPSPSSTGSTSLIIDDSTNTSGQSATLNETTYNSGSYIYQEGYLSGLAPAQIDWFDNTSGSIGGVNRLTIDGGSGDNTFTIANTGNLYYGTYLNSGYSFNTVNVEGTTGSITVDGDSGSQAVYVGSNGSGFGGTLANIHGSVFVENSNTSGTSSLYIDDSGDSTGQTWNLYFDEVTCSGMPSYVSWNTYGPGYGGVTYLQVRGGSGFNTMYVNSTGSSPYSYGTDVYTGTGGADVYVYNTLGFTDVINQGGQDYVYVGSDGTNADSTLANINGGVDVYGAGSTYLYLGDSGDTNSRTVNMYDGYLTGLAPATIYWSPTSSSTGGVTLLDVLGSGGGSTYTVNNTSQFYNYTFLATGGGNDTVNVLATQGGLYDYNSGGQDNTYVGTSSGSFGTGTVANINGFVDAYGAGGTFLYVDDTADAGSHTVTMSSTSITGLAPAPIEWTATSTSTGGVIGLDLLGSGGGSTYNFTNTASFYYRTYFQTGHGNDAVNVQATTGALDVGNGGGSDTVTIGSLAPSLGGTLAGINGLIFVSDNPGATTTLIVDDSGDSNNRTAVVDRGSSSSSMKLTGLGNTGIIYYGLTVPSLTIEGGSGADTWDVNATAAGSTTTINAGNGSNTFVLTPSSASLGNIQGAVNLHGGTGANTLTVDDQNDASNDTYTLAVGSIARTGAAAISYSGTGSVTVNGSNTAAITYNINSTAAGTPLTLNGGSGANAFNLAPSSQNLNNLAGAVTINAGSASAVNLYDQLNAAAATYTVTSTNVSRSGFGGLTYAGVGKVVLNGGSAADTYNINSTAAGTPVTLNGGSGANIFNLTPVSENLSNLAGAISINAGSASTINVDDQLNAAVSTYTVTASSVGRSGFGGLTYAGVGKVVLNGGSAGDTYDINGTAAATPVTVNAGNGNNAFVLTSASDLLANIQGALTLHGGTGSNTLTVDDQADATNDTYTLATGSITRTGVAAIAYSSIASVTVNGSSTAAITYNINTTAAGTPLILNGGTGANVFNLTPTSKNLNNLAGAVTINAGSASTVNVDDQSNAAVATYTVTATNLSRSGFAGLTYAGLGTLALNGGSAADIYNIQNTAAGSTVKVTGGAANDTFNLGNSNSLSGLLGAVTVNGGGGSNTLTANDSASASGQSYTLSSTQLTRSGIGAITYSSLAALNISGSPNDTLTLLSPVPTVATTFTGGTGSNKLVGANASNSWTISGANAGKLDSVSFSNVQNLVGGNSTDTFSFTSTSASEASINGGSGSSSKTLSYSALPATFAVTVNLASNTASLITGTFSNINAVTGTTDAANTLTGPNSSNTWTITGANAGKVNSFSFTNMPNLVGGTGTDSFTLSGTSPSVASINGGGGTNTLTGANVSNAWTISGANAGKLNSIAYSNIQNLVGGNLSNTFSFTSASASEASINGGSGSSSKTLSYSALPATFAVTVNLATNTASLITGTFSNINALTGTTDTANTLTGPNSSSTWTISGANTGKVNSFSFTNMPNLIGGNLSNTFSFTSTSASEASINGGSGSSSKTLSYSALPATFAVTVNLATNTASLITGTFSNINAVTGTTDTANKLTGPNSTNQWTINGANSGTVNSFSFSHMPNLVGGTGVDTFKFSGTTATALSIKGGGAPTHQGDWLDYSSLPSSSTVTVNLATGSATNVNGGAAGAVSGIQNVIGTSSGTNVLTGNSQGNILIGGSGLNTLTGGSGNSLLIGGSGHGTITGGAGQDILIAGTTTYVPTTTGGRTSLMAILAELQSADTFAQKVYDLIHGTDSGDPNGHGSDLNGANQLTWGGGTPTVKPSTGSFTLSGDTSAQTTADWFFSSASSTVNDFNDDGVQDEHNNNTIGVF